jgi:hypothetical protein
MRQMPPTGLAEDKDKEAVFTFGFRLGSHCSTSTFDGSCWIVGAHLVKFEGRSFASTSYWLAKILASILARIFFSDHNHTSAP